MISRTCAAVRSGRSRLSANASSSISAGVRGATTRGRGTSASNPPRRYARIQRSSVPRATRTSRPSGPTCSRSHRRADQPAALRLRQAGIGGVADQRVPEQPDLPATVFIHAVLPALSFTSAGPSQLTAPPGRGNSCCQAARRPTARTRSATDHPDRTATPTPSPRPRSLPAHPRPRSPAGSTGPSSGSSTTAHRVKCALIRSARSANRRSQPRTVSAGTPNRPAIGRCPSPATFASIAAPITDTSSRRRNNATSGSSTCVPAHPRHRARRGRNNRSPSRAAQHPLPRVPPRPQHPPTRRTPKQPADQLSLDPRLLGAYDQHRVPPPASKRALPTTDQADGRALARSGTREACHHRRPHHHDERHEHPRSCPNSAALNRNHCL